MGSIKDAHILGRRPPRKIENILSVCKLTPI
jgi:hypothetical protein